DAHLVARDERDARAAVWRGGVREAGRRELLIARLHHLEARGEVDPDLETVGPAAALAHARGRHLGVDDARARRHPLDVAGAEHATVAGRVLMLHLSLEDVRHGLE